MNDATQTRTAALGEGMTPDQHSFLTSLTKAAEEDRVSTHMFRWLLDVHDLVPADLDNIEAILQRRIAGHTKAHGFVVSQRAEKIA